MTDAPQVAPGTLEGTTTVETAKVRRLSRILLMIFGVRAGAFPSKRQPSNAVSMALCCGWDKTPCPTVLRYLTPATACQTSGKV